MLMNMSVHDPSYQSFHLLLLLQCHIQDSGKDKWEEIKTEIKDVEDKISDGTIVVTDAQSGEEFDASKCPNVTVK